MTLQYCPRCDAGSVSVITQSETFNIRGLDVTVDINLYYCGTCHGKFSCKDIGDPFSKAYERYFEITGKRISLQSHKGLI